MTTADTGVAANAGADFIFLAAECLVNAIGVCNVLTTHSDIVNLSVCNCFFRLIKGDCADNTDWNIKSSLELCCILDVDAVLNVGCGENERHEFIDCKAATGDKKHINLILNGLCKFDYFLNLGRAFNNIGCAETVLNSNIVAAFSTDCIKKLNCKAAAVLEALSAVFISSLVENGVKEKRGS